MEEADDIDDDSAPVIRLVNLMIAEAVQLRASDIHVEPFEHRVRIRYRIDGQCVEREAAPRRMLSAIIARIKILSKIDISEKRRPTDGRIKITVGDKQLDLRVSIIPTNHGQSCVMRSVGQRQYQSRYPANSGYPNEISGISIRLSSDPTGSFW